jgi:hypothetical protein
MIVITVTHERDALDRLMSMFYTMLNEWERDTITSIRVGIDPMDDGVKFSVNHATWSPPCYGVISAAPITNAPHITAPMPPCGCRGDDCFQEDNPHQVPQRECRRGRVPRL